MIVDGQPVRPLSGTKRRPFCVIASWILSAIATLAVVLPLASRSSTTCHSAHLSPRASRRSPPIVIPHRLPVGRVLHESVSSIPSAMPRTEQPAGSPGLRSLSPSVPTATLQLTCALAWAFGLASGLILGLRTRPSYFAAAFWTGVTRWSRLPPRRAAESPEEQNEERDKDGLYFGTYSTFWSDPSQIIGVIAFSTVLLVFFVGGQVLSGLLLPFLLGGDASMLGTWDFWLKF